MAAIAGFLLTAIPNWTRPASGQRQSAGAAGWFVAAGPHCLPALGACSSVDRRRGRPFLSGGAGRCRRARDRCRAELAQLADGRAGERSRDRQSADAPGGRRRRRAIWAGMAAGACRRYRSDLGDGRPYRAELHAQLAGQAPGRQDCPPAMRWSTSSRLASCMRVSFGWAFLPAFRRLDCCFWSARRSISGACCAGAGLPTAEPLLLVLHVGYGWLVLGAALLGLAITRCRRAAQRGHPCADGGPIGTMILAVMTRTTLGHTGRALSADRVTGLIYILYRLAAVVRVAAAFEADWTMPLLIASACFWIFAFAGFVLAYGPMLLLPRGDR